MSVREDVIAGVELVAHGLGELCERMTFVGGAVAALYIDDPAAPDVRPTEDIDCVVETVSYAEHVRLEQALREKGFVPMPGGPICRWTFGDVVVDVMPVDDSILGFTNRWYRDGIAKREQRVLPGGTSIYVFALPHYLASKLEAFRGRGNSDWFESKDIEDILAVFDGRSSIEQDLDGATGEVREYLADEFAKLVAHRDRAEILSRYFATDVTGRARARRIETMLAKFVGK